MMKMERGRRSEERVEKMEERERERKWIFIGMKKMAIQLDRREII
jgi:hypothetical protein